MCEFSEKLVVWLDRELPAGESAEVERHFEACPECRGRVDSYKRVSAGVDAYCENALATSARHRTNPWTAVAAAVGVAAALVGLSLVWPKQRAQLPALPESRQVVSATPPFAASTAPSSVPSTPAIRPRPLARNVQAQAKDAAVPATPPVHNASFVPQEPVIQISIPADDMFPPGAVPQGMQFIADVTISPDGSAERMRLRPRLAGFERSTVEP